MEPKPHKEQNPHHQPSSSELLSSAKLVAEAAKTTLSHGKEEVDKARVAGAAADLLGAASHYGKLEEKGFGKYVDKAENYLHKYATNTTTTTSAAHSGHAATAETHPEGGDGHSESGYGDYLKMAQGFLKKH